MGISKYKKLSRNLEIMYHIESVLKNETNFNEILGIALDMIMNESEAESGTLWIFSDDKNYLSPLVIKGDKVDELRDFRLPAGTGIAGWVTEHNQPEIVEDCEKDSRFSDSADKIAGHRTKTMVCVPMSTENNIFGCVQLINKKNGALFTEDDMELCLVFSALITVHIEANGISAKFIEKRPRIKLANITKEYTQGKITTTVLNGINLTIYEHELLIILGTSGAGKSTLLNILGGMDSATSGTISIDGADYSGALPRERALYRRNKIGFIFQSYNLISNLTAYENIRIALEIAKLPIVDIEEALDWVGLAEKKNRFPYQLSGGEQQRVSIARALAKKPEVILADEPTGALDEENGLEVLKLLERISREKKGTVAIITHNASYSQIADRVIKMKNGIISEIINNPYPLTVEEGLI